MQFVQNFPFFCILLTLMGAVASSVMNSRMARRTTLFLILADLAMNVSVMIYTLQTGDSYAYKMGHFPAPWGNEIRVGVLETVSLTVFLLVILFAKAELPDLRSSEEADEAAMMKHSLLAHKEFVAGVAAQFLYVAAQVGIGAFFINLYIECWPGGTAQQGAFFLSIAMLCLLIGRFVSTGIMTKIAPAKLLAVYGVVCVILTGVVFTAVEYVSVIALIAVFFFISIMFPTIFAMGTKNLGTRKKLGGSYMIMAIVGGAIMPYFMGLIADYTHTAAAFLLPLCCFVCVVLYGAAYGRLVKE